MAPKHSTNPWIAHVHRYRAIKARKGTPVSWNAALKRAGATYRYEPAFKGGWDEKHIAKHEIAKVIDDLSKEFVMKTFPFLLQKNGDENVDDEALKTFKVWIANRLGADGRVTFKVRDHEIEFKGAARDTAFGFVVVTGEGDRREERCCINNDSMPDPRTLAIKLIFESINPLSNYLA